MSEALIKQWQKAKNAVDSAKKWNNLPKGNRYSTQDTFEIRLANCVAPKLVRYGQKYAGDTNYWESSEEFNQAVLEHIVKDWKNIYPEVIAIMEKKERESLQACEAYITEMQTLINESKEI